MRFLQAQRFDKYSNLVPLIQLMLVQAPSTAGNERIFSMMNLIKTKRRNRLAPGTLQSLLMIKMHSVAVNCEEVLKELISGEMKTKAVRKK